uniref:Dynein light chain n=1 Tax=Panagrolaimus sp. JU765 TaxID=591449 RepID=A0AC34RQU3_9BILA
MVEKARIKKSRDLPEIICRAAVQIVIEATDRYLPHSTSRIQFYGQVADYVRDRLEAMANGRWAVFVCQEGAMTASDKKGYAIIQCQINSTEVFASIIVKCSD